MDRKKKTHPSLVYYGERTLKDDFPLVLAIGREPQVDEETAPGMGPYDFAKHPNVAFWNIAYSLMAKCDGRPDFRTHSLKKECVGRQASPIVFADALPIGLSDQNSAGAKAQARQSVTKARASEHITHILGLEILNRVRFVILSGLSPKPFQFSAVLLKKGLSETGKPFIETPFLYPTNTSAIKSQIDLANGWAHMRKILNEFRSRAHTH